MHRPVRVPKTRLGRQAAGRWRCVASILGTCPISLVAVFASLRSNRLSEATGLDFEVVLQGARLLWRGRKDHQELELREPLPMGTVAALMPFKVDTFDTLKDVVSGALCIMSESWALPLAGFASLAWLPWVHSTLLRDTECVADISGSYFPFASAQPVHDESEVLLAESGELFARAQTTPGKIRLLLWEAGPQGVFALFCFFGMRVQVCHLHAAGSSTPLNSLWLAMQRAAQPVDDALHREAPGGALASGNVPLQTLLLGIILHAEEELRETASAQARRGIQPEPLTATT
eukprot:s5121_g5.t1